MRETQGWRDTIPFTPAGMMAKWPWPCWFATRHQTGGVHHGLLPTDPKTQPWSQIHSKHHKLAPQIHTFLARGGDKIMQGCLERKGKSMASLQISGGKRQTASPGWVKKRKTPLS